MRTHSDVRGEALNSTTSRHEFTTSTNTRKGFDIIVSLRQRILFPLADHESGSGESSLISCEMIRTVQDGRKEGPTNRARRSYFRAVSGLFAVLLHR